VVAAFAAPYYGEAALLLRSRKAMFHLAGIRGIVQTGAAFPAIPRLAKPAIISSAKGLPKVS